MIKNNKEFILPIISAISEHIRHRNDFVSYGKLGGRPKSPNKKEKKISIALTSQSYGKLADDFSRSRLPKFADFCRHRLEGRDTENSLDLLEIKKQLAEQTQNFIRIRNFFNSGHFDASEKAKYLEEIKQAIEKNKQILQCMQQLL